MELLDYFTSISGLVMNKGKSEIYIAGLSTQQSQITSQASGLQPGTLPVKYLGLPLLSKTLSSQDCQALIQRIKTKLQSWYVKNLSYAGRLQLLSSVIQNIISYWCATFILPARCIKDLNSLCRKFLWSGSSENAKSAKVKWSQVCSPKSEGGLGLKDLKVWNSVFGLKLIWKLFSTSGSLWVAWCRKYRLRGKSFWSLKQNSGGAHMWKQILKLRSEAQPFLSCKVGDGKRCSFWHDNWTPFGPLHTFLSPDAHSTMGVPLQAKVAAVASDQGWNIGGARSSQAEQLLCYLTTVNISNQQDIFLWKGKNDIPKPEFVFADTCNICRTHAPIVAWADKVWFKGGIPRQAFTLWLACQDRLPTLSRLRSWKVTEEDTCYLCEIYAETRDHLFLHCPYAYDLWRWVFAKFQAGFMGFRSWNSLLFWLSSRSTVCPDWQDSMMSLKRLVTHEAIYSLWQERNERAFNSHRTPVETLIRAFEKKTKQVCLARKDLKNFNHCLLWLREPIHH